MASRPIFLALAEADHLVSERSFDFHWNSGFAAVQKKKNIIALHETARRNGLFPVLEVSTKSEEKLGQRLSAFNLRIKTIQGEMTIESAFQGSKVFSRGGPYTDLYGLDSRSAKKDERLKSSGHLIGFNFLGQEWPLEPKTAFYDWLYLTALRPHKEFLRVLFRYKGFSDIEFNPERSINCQARTCALLVSLIKLDALDDALTSQQRFISVIESDSFKQPHSNAPIQRPLIDDE